ncbi:MULTISPECIES: SanA/YdcF family protein [Salegentibacter]|uniref:SanA/YdcF family protein n=1 Tax=Salegentibacter TaxID=143222 RepID=UPI00187B2C2E|nr:MULTISPECIES: ElyC/SanA/YdcF family protein [Salegentibacter]MBE7639355.1 vancomycin high temperature exclusion protein [Salegentibacter sp. BLCTC]MBI6116418.1 YdcF family protein [Salegentibacter maritimus]
MSKRKLKLIISIIILGTFTLIFFSNYTIEQATENKTFFDVSAIDKNEVGLVLGTSKYLSDGRINLYFKYRIDATVDLFKNGKIDFVLVSGDNGSEDYDEPTDFKNELIKRGIPENRIYLDYAGFRTLDSIVRAKEIFGQDNFTIISQQFHNERAIYLAEKHGVKAIGYNAKDLDGKFGWNVKLREYLARTKVFLDIFFDVEPKFYGKKMEIG